MTVIINNGDNPIIVGDVNSSDNLTIMGKITVSHLISSTKGHTLSPFVPCFNTFNKNQWGLKILMLDLSNQDLSGEKFKEALVNSAYTYDFPRSVKGPVDCHDSCLYGSDLSWMILEESTFLNADLRKTTLVGTRLEKAKTKGALVEHNFGGKKWQDLNLMPELEDGSVLVWKHVRNDFYYGGDVVPGCYYGNLGYPYTLGEEFECPSMNCAGPMGALKDWALLSSKKSNAYVMAIAAKALYSYDVKNGIYYAMKGTPLAVYSASKEQLFAANNDPNMETDIDLTLHELAKNTSIIDPLELIM